MTPAAIDRIEVLPGVLRVNTGGDATLLATALDAYGNTIQETTFAWSATVGSITPSTDGRSASFSAGAQGGFGRIVVTSEGRSAAVEVSVVGSSGLPFLPDQVFGQPTPVLLAIVTAVLFMGLVFSAARNCRLKRVARNANRLAMARGATGSRTRAWDKEEEEEPELYSR